MEYQKMLLGNEAYEVRLVRSSYPEHCHSETELLYCVEGNMNVFVGDKKYFLEKGSVIIISSLEMHKLSIESGGTIALVLEFGSQFLGSKFYEFATLSFENCLIESKDDSSYKSRILKPVERLYYEYINQEVGCEWVIQGLLYEIFAMIVRHIPTTNSSGNTKKDLEKYLKVQKVFDLVANEYQKEITLTHASSCAGYDPRAFCRLFKSVTNMTFHSYLNSYRINVAMRLLEQKSYSVGEIAQNVGIPVVKSFNRLFKSYTGMSPTQYSKKFTG